MELHVLGTRGIPARHGGFETFAEKLALFLTSRGHRVTVYCQLGPHESRFTDTWNGVTRIGLPHGNGALGTILFDLESARLASRHRSATVLTLGYNTAIFSFIHRLRGVHHLMNMDGMEWKRKKWSAAQKAWLWINEWCGLHLADRLVADHPHIRRILSKKIAANKIAVIPYGAEPVEQADPEIVRRLGLEPQGYALVVARPEPENSILEIVQAYRAHQRPFHLVILGRYLPEKNPYHAEVLKHAAHSNIIFLGAIHEPEVVAALRFHALLYVHGHQVGGTNPSLVESLAAGNAVLAHDNQFNRWVAGWTAGYFASPEDLACLFDEVPQDSERLRIMRAGSLAQHQRLFRQEFIMQAYEELLQTDLMGQQRWQLVTPSLARTDPAAMPHSTQPCPGYFSSVIMDILRSDSTAARQAQPCARCGQPVRVWLQDGCWIPSIHWHSTQQRQDRLN
jgi:glycosyltransferase involved in cell wall biosynthesis